MLDEFRFRLLKLIEASPSTTQRDMAGALGTSVGKLNYELKALVELGLVEVRVPDQPGRRQANVYLLTEKGREAKRMASARVLALRKQEFEQIREEIDELSREVHVINNSDNA